MSKLWKLAICACALSLSFALAACGGTSTSSSATNSSGASSASASSSATAADPSEKFVGDWKLAAAEMEGLIVTGDFGSEIFGESLEISMSLAKDNTGTMSLSDESADITWELDGDNEIIITPVDQDDDLNTATATYDDGVLALSLDDDEFTGTVYLSADGTIEGMGPISTDNATAITSESDLIGTWKLTGINMMGMSMYGDADNLEAMMGEDDSYSKIEISSDGTATIMGEEATWAVGSTGATITIDDFDISLKTLDGDLVLDIGELTDDLDGFDMVMLYSK